MDLRTRQIVTTLSVCFGASTLAALLKLAYGTGTNSLAFIADGIHSFFDSSATAVGMYSVFMANRPPDEGHPYGHEKFETVAAAVLAILLFLAAYEVGNQAYDRILNPSLPSFSMMGIVILIVTMAINLGVARYESKKATSLNSQFLASDALHNQSDIWITLAVLASSVSAHFRIPYMDAGVSLLITGYLLVLGVRLFKMNLRPLVDHSVLDPEKVRAVVASISEVLYCHGIRSRGHGSRLFLDLNIHLPGNMTLEKAHDLTHRVEDKLKQVFPDLADVVIHTEPHNHPPCSKSD